MQHFILNKIKFAEEKLKVKLPDDITEFLATLKSQNVAFKTEEWFFYTLSDSKENPDDNFIFESSEGFKKAWDVNGVVIASNGIGDYLVLLPDNVTGTIKDDIYISLHEYGEIRLFAEDIFSLQLYGPKDYLTSSDFYIKLDNGNVVQGIQANESYKHDQDDEIFGIGYGKRSKLDEWIDNNEFEKTHDILQGLEELRSCGIQELEIWALNQLSNLYLKGFGPILRDINKALEFNERAISLNSHKAYSNLAAAHLAGIGVNKDLEKALYYITKANELSKNRNIVDFLTKTKSKGLYNDEIKFIKRAIKENRE
jgi:hypothetical protein